MSQPVAALSLVRREIERVNSTQFPGLTQRLRQVPLAARHDMVFCKLYEAEHAMRNGDSELYKKLVTEAYSIGLCSIEALIEVEAETMGTLAGTSCCGDQIG